MGDKLTIGRISALAVFFPFFFIISSFIFVICEFPFDIKMGLLGIEAILYIRLVYLMFKLKENPKTTGYINGHKIIRRRNWNRQLTISSQYEAEHYESADIGWKGLSKVVLRGRA